MEVKGWLGRTGPSHLSGGVSPLTFLEGPLPAKVPQAFILQQQV